MPNYYIKYYYFCQLFFALFFYFIQKFDFYPRVLRIVRRKTQADKGLSSFCRLNFYAEGGNARIKYGAAAAVIKDGALLFGR